MGEVKDIRTLRADEIECRVGQCKKGKNGFGCSLLLYKDARCDMKLLDEVFGPMNWKREHSVIDGNLYCTISVWDDDKKQWVSRQDVGTESNTEKEKGQASDSFKRAGVNWGIGRELYTAPFIWIALEDGEYYQNGDKCKCTAPFFVNYIEYNEFREISCLEIIDKSRKIRFRHGAPTNLIKTIKSFVFESCGKDSEKAKSIYAETFASAEDNGKELSRRFSAFQKQAERLGKSK